MIVRLKLLIKAGVMMTMNIWKWLRSYLFSFLWAIILLVIWIFTKEYRVIFGVIASLFSLSSWPILHEKKDKAFKIKPTSSGKRIEAVFKLLSGAFLLSTAISLFLDDAYISLISRTGIISHVDFYFMYSFYALFLFFMSTIILVFLTKGLYAFSIRYDWFKEESNNYD